MYETNIKTSAMDKDKCHDPLINGNNMCYERENSFDLEKTAEAIKNDWNSSGLNDLMGINISEIEENDGEILKHDTYFSEGKQIYGEDSYGMGNQCYFQWDPNLSFNELMQKSEVVQSNDIHPLDNYGNANVNNEQAPSYDGNNNNNGSIRSENADGYYSQQKLDGIVDMQSSSNLLPQSDSGPLESLSNDRIVSSNSNDDLKSRLRKRTNITNVYNEEYSNPASPEYVEPPRKGKRNNKRAGSIETVRDLPKARKYVRKDDNEKNDDYINKRKKNNEAVRRSREKTKQLYNQRESEFEEMKKELELTKQKLEYTEKILHDERTEHSNTRRELEALRQGRPFHN